jgi:V8-like Glu-specific endopeptidase
MSSVSALKYVFALAGGLTLAGCDVPEPDRRTLDPMDLRSVSFTQSAAGNFECNFTMIGPDLSITSSHCVLYREPIFSVLNLDGEKILAEKGNQATPTSYWVSQQDATAGEAMLNDSYYRDVAEDKAIVLLTEPLGNASGVMSIAPLDSLTWKPIEDLPDMMIADIKLVTHWPTGTSGIESTFYAMNCQAVRMTGIDQVVAHNCPTRQGVSGSPLVIGDTPENYAVFAVHQGKTMRNNDDALAAAFAPAFKDRTFNFASVVGEMDELCEQLKNCRATRDQNGYAVLALTN